MLRRVNLALTSLPIGQDYLLVSCVHPSLVEAVETVSNHQEIEAFWKERWQAAWEKLEAARRHRKDVETENWTESIVSEDYFAYGQALKAENRALAEYAQVTRIYTEFLLHREPPDERAMIAGGA